MVPLAGIIDVAFLGHLAEIHYLAGVSLANVIFSYVYWSFGFLRMGTTGTTAQAVGRSQDREVWHIGLRNGCIALLLGGSLLLLQWPLRDIGFWLLSAEPDVELAGRAFFNARIWGAPAVLLNFVLIGWFLGRSHGGKVLLLSVIGNGANVVLDYWMIVRLGWSSAGAGVATALSQYLMLLVGLGLILYEGLPIVYSQQANGKIDWPHLWERQALGQVFSLNANIMVRTLALISAFGLFTNISAALGTTILAVNTLMLQVLTLTAYFIDGLAFATESIAGMINGRGDRPQLVPLLKLSGGLSLAVGISTALLFMLFPKTLFGQLTDHATIILATQDVVGWLLPVFGFGAIAFMLDGYFIGLTWGGVLRNSTVIATVLGFAPAATLAWVFKNVHGLWLAMTLFMLLRGLTLAVCVPETVRSSRNP